MVTPKCQSGPVSNLTLTAELLNLLAVRMWEIGVGRASDTLKTSFIVNPQVIGLCQYLGT